MSPLAIRVPEDLLEAWKQRRLAFCRAFGGTRTCDLLIPVLRSAHEIDSRSLIWR
jgi:hypothetical protein